MLKIFLQKLAFTMAALMMIVGIIPNSVSDAGRTGVSKHRNTKHFSRAVESTLRIEGTIEKIYSLKGGHQYLNVRCYRIIQSACFASEVKIDNIFVSMRYGNKYNGWPRTTDFRVGEKIELQGELIPLHKAYMVDENPGLPVLHFTHKPRGFFIYKGIRYS